MDSGASQHFLDSNLIPGVEKMMRDVKLLEPALKIDSDHVQPAELNPAFFKSTLEITMEAACP